MMWSRLAFLLLLQYRFLELSDAWTGADPRPRTVRRCGHRFASTFPTTSTTFALDFCHPRTSSASPGISSYSEASTKSTDRNTFSKSNPVVCRSRSFPIYSQKRRHYDADRAVSSRDRFPWFSSFSSCSDSAEGWLATTRSNESLQEDELVSSTLPLSTGLTQIQSIVLQPLIILLDDSSRLIQDFHGVWTYADLSPDTPQTAAGKAFLATNLAYAAAGAAMTWAGEPALGLLTEIAAVASFNYHYQQLEPNNNRFTVRLALLVDYVAAFTSIGVALLYLFTYLGGSSSQRMSNILSEIRTGPLDMDALTAIATRIGDIVSTIDSSVTNGVGVAVLGLAFLGLSWAYEKGRTYMIFHSLWHLLSAYAGFLIGTLNHP